MTLVASDEEEVEAADQSATAAALSAVVYVQEVVRVASEAILDQGIDTPTTEHTGDEYAIEIAGWVVGRQQPVASVEVFAVSKLVKTAPVCLVRPGVTERYPDHPGPSGYVLTVGLVGLPEEFELIINAVFADGSRQTLGRIKGRCRPPASSYIPELSPLLLTSLGRMGTTWMMRLLSEHPSVVAYRGYPQEAMVARYWVHQLRVLTAPADYVASSDPDSFATDVFRVGHNPFYGPLLRGNPVMGWLGRDHVERMAAFCQETVDGFYTRLAEIQDDRGARYFAEKALPDHIPTMMTGMYPQMREVFLVRDLRDVVCSMTAFNAKRGYYSFGRENTANDVEFVRRLAVDMTTLAKAWEARASASYLVRYEELIESPKETLGDVFAYVGLDADAATVDEVLRRASEESGELDAHRTSRDPAASIGRWKTDLDPDLIEECNRQFLPVMARLGYEVD